jgi:hypothetical protein
MSGRPTILRRQSSKVRFAADDTVHDVGTGPTDQSPSQPTRQASQSARSELEHYEISTNPFRPVEMVSRTQATNDGTYHPNLSGEERIAPYPTGPPPLPRSVADTHPSDGYTPVPARLAGRHQPGILSHRPTLDTVYSANNQDDRQDDPHLGAPRGPVDPSQNRTYLDQSVQHSPHSAASNNSGQSRNNSSMQANPQVGYRGPDIAAPPQVYNPANRSPRGPDNYPQYPQNMPPMQGSPRDSRSGTDPYFSYRQYGEPGNIVYSSPREVPQHLPLPPPDMRRESDTTLRGEEEDKYSKGSNNSSAYASKNRFSRPRSWSDSSESKVRRRNTQEVEAAREISQDGESYHARGGVLSQLLRLTAGSGLRRRPTATGGDGQASAISSRATSTVGGDFPTLSNLGMKRSYSTASTLYGGHDEYDDLDPRVTGQKKKKNMRTMSLGDLMHLRDHDGRKRQKEVVKLHVAGKLGVVPD